MEGRSSRREKQRQGRVIAIGASHLVCFSLRSDTIDTFRAHSHPDSTPSAHAQPQRPCPIDDRADVERTRDDGQRSLGMQRRCGAEGLQGRSLGTTVRRTLFLPLTPSEYVSLLIEQYPPCFTNTEHAFRTFWQRRDDGKKGRGGRRGNDCMEGSVNCNRCVAHSFLPFFSLRHQQHLPRTRPSPLEIVRASGR